jgi:hypothetical protein
LPVGGAPFYDVPVVVELGVVVVEEVVMCQDIGNSYVSGHR